MCDRLARNGRFRSPLAPAWLRICTPPRRELCFDQATGRANSSRPANSSPEQQVEDVSRQTAISASLPEPLRPKHERRRGESSVSQNVKNGKNQLFTLRVGRPPLFGPAESRFQGAAAKVGTAILSFDIAKSIKNTGEISNVRLGSAFRSPCATDSSIYVAKSLNTQGKSMNTQNSAGTK